MTACLFSHFVHLKPILSGGGGGGVWEMEKNNVEAIGTDFSTISANYTTPVETFVSVDTTGIYSGVVSGGGTWLIKGGPEDIAGASYAGGGLLIATGYNTASTTTVESGANVQLGRDVNALTGAIVGNIISVQSGATLDIVGANTTPFVKTQSLNVLAGGVVNYEGPDVCGKGTFTNNGGITNNGVINIDESKISPTNTGITGTGVINVADGGTLANGAFPIAATQTLNLNGCGWCNASNVQEGALFFGGAVTIAAKINIESDTCMKAAGGDKTTFSGVLSGSSKLTLGNGTDSSPRYGEPSFSNAANDFTGDLLIQNTTLLDSHPLAFDQSNVTLGNFGAIQSTTTMTYKSLASDFANSIITTWNVPIILTDNGVTTYAGRIVNSAAGFSTVTLDGAGEELILTNPAVVNSGYRAVNGAKVSFTGGQGVGKVDVENGSTFTFGKTTTGYVYPGPVNMTGNSTLEVHAITPSSTGRFVTYGEFNVTGGYKVDMIHPMVAGTYNILQAAAGGTGVGQIPTIGVNNTGLTPTFSWSGQFLRVTLA